MKNSHKFLVLLWGLLILNSAFANPKNWGHSRPILLTPILWEGKTLADVWINPDRELRIDRIDFINSLNPILTKEALKTLKGVNPDSPYFTERELRKYSFNIFFNSQELVLELAVPKSYRKKQSLNLQSRYGNYPLVEPENFSSYLNVDASTFNPGQDNEFRSLYSILNLNYKGLILNSGGYYNSSLEDQKLNREYSRLIFDDSDNRARYTLGDLNYRVSRLQEQVTGAGIGIQNEFSIQPELLNQRYNNFEIELKRPSLVEIYLNDARVYSGRHDAGVLNLKELPLILGMNTIIIHLTDQNGRRETINFNQSYHQNVLPVGTSDYSLNVFSPSSVNDENELEYTQERYFSGFYRYGLRPDLTLEANYQSRENRNLRGVGLSKSFSLSMWELYYNQSCQDSDCKSAVFLGSQSQISNSFKNLYFQFSFRNFEKEFSSISNQSAINRNQWSTNGVYAMNSVSSFGLGYEELDPFNSDPNKFATIEYGHRFNGRLSLSTRIRNEISGQDNKSILFSINWNEMNGLISGFHAIDPEQNTFNNQINLNKRYASTHLYASANYDKNNSQESNRIFTEIDTTRGSLRLIRNAQAENIQEQVNLRFALTASSKHIGIGRYVNNSYVVLESNSDSDLYVFNEFQTQLNKRSSLHVTDLTPYRINPFKLDLDQLSFEEEVNESLIYVKPTHLSGSYFKFNVRKTKALRFKLLAKDSLLVRYKKGSLTKIGSHSPVNFVTGKNGLVFVEGVEPGSYQLKLSDSENSVILEIPEYKGFTNLGVINVD